MTRHFEPGQPVKVNSTGTGRWALDAVVVKEITRWGVKNRIYFVRVQLPDFHVGRRRFRGLPLDVPNQRRFIYTLDEWERSMNDNRDQAAEKAGT